MADIELLFRQVVDVGYRVHEDIGSGLLESVYETILADRLRQVGLKTETQKPVDIIIDGKTFKGAFRADMVVEDTLLLEIKSVETLSAVHIKQTLTYIRLLNMPLGMLINFGGATFKGNVKRIMNDRASSK